MLNELFDVLRHGPNGLSEASFIAFVAIGTMCTAAFVLLARAWRPTKQKVLCEMNSYGRLEYDYRVKTITQRSRYARVLGAWVLTCIPYAWVAFHAVSVHYALSEAFHHGRTIGLIVNLCGWMPSLMVALCATALVRVNLTPAAFNKRYMFGKSKGNYVLTNPDHRRFGIARQEFADF